MSVYSGGGEAGAGRQGAWGTCDKVQRRDVKEQTTDTGPE